MKPGFIPASVDQDGQLCPTTCWSSRKILHSQKGGIRWNGFAQGKPVPAGDISRWHELLKRCPPGSFALGRTVS